MISRLHWLFPSTLCSINELDTRLRQRLDGAHIQSLERALTYLVPTVCFSTQLGISRSVSGRPARTNTDFGAAVSVEAFQRFHQRDNIVDGTVNYRFCSGIDTAGLNDDRSIIRPQLPLDIRYRGRLNVHRFHGHHDRGLGPRSFHLLTFTHPPGTTPRRSRDGEELTQGHRDDRRERHIPLARAPHTATVLLHQCLLFLPAGPSKWFRFQHAHTIAQLGAVLDGSDFGGTHRVNHGHALLQPPQTHEGQNGLGCAVCDWHGCLGRRVRVPEVAG
jgi:hypothetical protein